jgi:hypothetical protein
MKQESVTVTKQRVPFNEDTIDEQYELAFKAQHACRMCLPGEPREIGDRGYSITEMREMPYDRRGRRYKYAVGFLVSHEERLDERSGDRFRLKTIGSITIAALEDLSLTVMSRHGDVDEILECIEKA